MKLCDTFTGSAFQSCADKCVRNTHHHSSEGTFLVTTPDDQPIHRWIEAKLLQLVGAKADGWVGYLYTPKFYEQVVLPNVTAGARSAGRDPDELELSCEIICCVHPNREIALERAKKHVGFYIAHPVSDVVAEIEGVQDLVTELRINMLQKGLAAFEDTPEELVELFSITGTPEECRQKLEQYSDLPHLALHTSYVPPFTAAESEDCYLQIIDAFKR